MKAGTPDGMFSLYPTNSAAVEFYRSCVFMQKLMWVNVKCTLKLFNVKFYENQFSEAHSVREVP
jgi:hypothetical protein